MLKKIHAIAAAAFCLVLGSGTALAYPGYPTPRHPDPYYAQPSGYSAANYGSYTSRYLNTNGGVFSMTLGPAFAPTEAVDSGYRKFEASTTGVSADAEIGYHWGRFSWTFSFMLRGGWANEATEFYHCPGGWLEGNCFEYDAIREGEWDGYFMGLGMMLDFMLPVSDATFFTLGFGFDVPIGLAMDREHSESQFSFKFRLSVQHFISEHLALGGSLKLSGLYAGEEDLWDQVVFEKDECKGTNFYIEPHFAMTYVF